MNKTPDFAGTVNNPNTTNNSQLNLTNNNINNNKIASNNNPNNNNKSITLNSHSKINALKLSNNSEAEGFLKHSNSLANTQLQSKSTISRLTRKINSEEALGNSNNNNLIDNSYFRTSGVSANANPFGKNVAGGNASRDFGSKLNVAANNNNSNSNKANVGNLSLSNGNNFNSGFANNYSSKNNENTASPVVSKNNSEKLQVKKLLINDHNSNGNSGNQNNYPISGSFSDKSIEVVNYSKSKNNNINNNFRSSKHADEDETGNSTGMKKVLCDKLSKLFNNNHSNNNNNLNFNAAKNSNNSSNFNNSNNISIVSNPNALKTSKTVAFDNNFNGNLNQIKGKNGNYAKKVAFRSLAGKTENGSTKTNQDNFMIMENILSCEDYKIYGVFDGHGN